MSTRSHRPRAHACALLMLSGLMFAAPAAHATAPDAPLDGPEGWRKVLLYATCAFQVFRTITPADGVAAALFCSRLFSDEPPLPNGGL